MLHRVREALSLVKFVSVYRMRVRIGHVVPRGEEPWSGVLTVIVHLSAALSRRGHHVEVWQLHEWSRDAYADQLRLLDSAGVDQIPLTSDLSIWRRGRAAASLADDRAVDLVHLHGAFNQSNTAVSRAIRRPYVFSPHSGYDPVSLGRSRRTKQLYGLLFERTMLKRASLLVALTDVELTQVRSFGAKGPCDVIPNGVEAAPSDVDPRPFRRELGIALDTPLAVFVGRLDVYRKGLDVLVRGVAEARAWHLALVGPRFRDVEDLEVMIASLGVANRIHLTGERHGRRLHEAFAACDLFALLSRWEGLPMALLEALSFSKPAVVSPTVERLVGVEGAGAGWAVAEAQLGVLLHTLRDEGRAELVARGVAARRLAGRYDWGTVAQRYEAAYERVLGSKEPVRP
jgi:glycosyltransferase involved in cell wall biosynthesis